MTTKVFGIREKDFFQFIKKINEFYEKHQENIFVTQTNYEEGYWNAIIYFDSQVPKGINSPLTQLDKENFASSPPTPEQIATLKKFNLPIPKTKLKAIQIIKESIEKRGKDEEYKSKRNASAI